MIPGGSSAAHARRRPSRDSAGRSVPGAVIAATAPLATSSRHSREAPARSETNRRRPAGEQRAGDGDAEEAPCPRPPAERADRRRERGHVGEPLRRRARQRPRDQRVHRRVDAALRRATRRRLRTALADRLQGAGQIPAPERPRAGQERW
jgi:hypothetical protein